MTEASPVPPRRRARARATLLLAAVFVLGLLGGVVLERVRLRRLATPVAAEVQERRRDRLFDALDLSAAQRQQVDSILDLRSAQAAERWQETRGAFGAIVDSARVDVGEVLTPQQEVLFERLLNRQRRRMPWLGGG